MTGSASARGRSGLALGKPSGFVGWLLRQPVRLYEHDLGWLLGHRFMEIAHYGRKSGRIHRSVVEVVRFDAATKEVIVVSAWRGHTDWYRNIQSHPALEIRIGPLRFAPQQRFLTPDETVHEMQSYVHEHRLAGRLMPWLFGIDMRGPQDEWRANVADFFKGVSFRPAVAQPIAAASPPS